MSNYENQLKTVARKFASDQFAEDDYDNEKMLKDATSFIYGIYLIFPKPEEIKSLTNDGENLYLVRYNPYILLLTKTATAANCGIVDYGDKKVTIIFTDKRFADSDPAVQKAIIAHEIGHTMSGHTAEHNRRTLKKENQADSYAATIIGVDNMVAALSKMNTRNLIGKLELKIRIRMLKKHK